MFQNYLRNLQYKHGPEILGSNFYIESLNSCDLTMIHIESTDETGHVGKAELKVQAVEDFDKRVVGRVLEKIKSFKDYRILVMSDHPTPIDIRTHTSDPVPFAILDSSDDSVRNEGHVYTEDSASNSETFIDDGWKLMGMLLKKR